MPHLKKTEAKKHFKASIRRITSTSTSTRILHSTLTDDSLKCATKKKKKKKKIYILSKADLKEDTDDIKTTSCGREFQSKIVLGRKENRCAFVLE